ncbi:JAB1/Mov34/MPN/PAD-1 ubiquitin protease domain-containing protein [Hirsutella rhossiliensis]|uniref:JAB1/Mov34/MPN/PAD-1 ubiquitin protease domain-containing protein n=1 Tax=Hirsutella rhossiliensis TaxID=111463 RepID=A0A9P8SJ99_9HYPO|nr:JAB1/Mov34/MPN/PAD-1 ubiquitin protease domain-containing protein [Hirsutella rhossiliensis]KAH0964666.1 JAB1/Mov34/MPN/PAD-1 ubiquitin protease domain-containing protein [Hirsutella rhossiliensis]
MGLTSSSQRKMEPRSSSRPQSVAALAAQAENFRFNTNIPFKHWTRAAETLQQEASFARSDGDYGRAYMMLYRHSILVLKCLPTHPQFKDPESRRAFRPLSKRIDGVLGDLERIKPILEQEHAEWERTSSEAAHAARQRPAAPSSYADFAARDPSLSGPAKVLDASEHQELAVDLAQQELARRDKARRASRTSRSPDYQTSMTPGHGETAFHDGRSRVPDEHDLQRQMEAARRAMSLDEHADSDPGKFRDHTPAHMTTPIQYSYPSIAKSRPLEFDDSQRQQRPSPVPGPSRPPKERLLSPDIPDGPAVPPTDQPPRPPKGPLDGPPLPKKERLAFKPGAYLENGDPIRPVFLPSKLRSAFLEIASKNTRAGLEMCGILCGTPVNNALFVRCLLIPDQKCTSDTCETENEGAMFDYCASEDLLVLGWIHTHPTQTCFMSSRDLHTQAGYQVMMPESIAIVCAPKFKPEYGIFRLTHPPGLDHILDCKHQDTFHQHSIGNIYRDTEQPHGHVYDSDKLPFYVHDLRTK